MTLKAVISSDIDDVFLDLEDFAEVVTRYAGGDRASASTLTAIVTWHPTSKDDARGKGYLRRAEMLVKSSQSVTASDAFKVGGIRCEVESVSHPDDGVTIVNLVQYEGEAKGVRKAGEV